MNLELASTLRENAERQNTMIITNLVIDYRFFVRFQIGKFNATEKSTQEKCFLGLDELQS